MFFLRLREDLEAILKRDPAARTKLELLLCYPGVHALIGWRMAHWLWRRNFKLLARMISSAARFVSGAEIHPGAAIGRRLFIDHATALVIGETAEVGDDVTLYHGVTLGGTSLEKGKRHPTLGNGVIVGAGAQILGPVHVGEGARIGANAVVLKDVAPGATMVGVPAKAVVPQDACSQDAFYAYGVPSRGLPDPMARTIEALREQIRLLARRVQALEADAAPAASAGKDEPKDDHERNGGRQRRATRAEPGEEGL